MCGQDFAEVKQRISNLLAFTLVFARCKCQLPGLVSASGSILPSHQGASQEGKKSAFCINWEIKHNWRSGGELLSDFSGGAEGKTFSLKLV